MFAQIVVEHTDGRRCGASLVSLRTALTSAWCATNRAGTYGPVDRVWVRAPDVDQRRLVSRLSMLQFQHLAMEDTWSGPDMDLALLNLMEPFSAGEATRPILMATQPSECTEGATCYVVRMLGSKPSLQIVDAQLVAEDVCSKQFSGWGLLRGSGLCLAGATLCSVGALSAAVRRNRAGSDGCLSAE